MSDSPQPTAKQLDALFERGNNFIRLGNFGAAAGDYTTVLTHRPGFGPAHFNRGICYLSAGDYAAARADFDAALHAQPDFAEALVNRAIAAQHLGDYPAALAETRDALLPRLVGGALRVWDVDIKEEKHDK